MAEKIKKLKIKKPFRKSIKSKVFEKKILKKIYIQKDKEFIQSLYKKDPQGNYLLNKDEFTKEETKRIKSIADAVNKNKGGIFDLVKVTPLLVIVGVIVIFSIFFKNMLLTQALKTGLEALFNAKAEIQGLNFELLNTKITIKHLAVADADAPMKNLFEFDKTEINLNAPQLLLGKFVAKNIECQGISWNTDRKTSGNLPNKQEKKNETKGQDKKQDKASQPFSLGKIDPAKIVEDNKTNIQTIKKLSNANIEITGMTNKWDNNLKSARKNVEKTSKGIDEVKKIDINSIKTAEQARQALNKINSYAPAVENLKHDIEKINKDFDLDKNKVDILKKDLQNSLDKDNNYFLSLINLPKGGLQGMAIAIANKFLAQKLGKIYIYALKARDYAIKLKDKDSEKEKKQKRNEDLQRRRGYNVYFPAQVYPNFLIQNLASSIGKKKDNNYMEAYLRDVSSDPDMWKKPVTFHFEQDKSGQEILLNGMINSRSNAEETFGLELQINNYPLEIQESLGFLNVKYFKSMYRLKTSFKLDKRGGTKGVAVINLSKIQMDMANKDDIINKVIYDTLTKTPNVVLEISYVFSPDGQVSIQGKSNIDGIISRKVGMLIQNYTKKYEKELKDSLMKQIGPDLKKNDALYSAFNKMDNDSQKNIKDTDGMQKTLDDKKKEIEGQVNKQTKDKLKDAGKNIKIPGF